MLYPLDHGLSATRNYFNTKLVRKVNQELPLEFFNPATAQWVPMLRIVDP